MNKVPELIDMYNAEVQRANMLQNQLALDQQRGAELKAENERLRREAAASLKADTLLESRLAKLHIENDRLRTQLSGQTCFVPPEFQQQLDDAMAKNVMLVEALGMLSKYVAYNGDDWVHQVAAAALNATPESPQQWLNKHDAEVRRNALLEAAKWFEARFFTCAKTGYSAEFELRRMADEVKPCASTNG